MNLDQQMKLYLNIVNSAQHFENVRIHLPKRYMGNGRENKNKNNPHSKISYAKDWPRSQQKYLGYEINRELGKLGLRNLSNAFTMPVYFLSKKNYNKAKHSKNGINNGRFKSISYYFELKRLEVATSKIDIPEDLTIKIQYLPKDTPREIFTENVMTQSLVSELQSRGDILALISIKKMKYRSKIPGYLFPLLFTGNFKGIPFTPEEKRVKRYATETWGYILKQDRDKFTEIVNVSEANMRMLVDDGPFMERIEQCVKQFEARKIGS